jgi:hypothetical protein
MPISNGRIPCPDISGKERKDGIELGNRKFVFGKKVAGLRINENGLGIY